MAEMTLTAAAEATGIPYDTLKKHAQRGQIRTSKDADGRPMIAQEDLEVYVAARNLTAAIDRAEGEPAAVFSREIAAAFGGLPASLKQAIAEAVAVRAGRLPKKGD
jgi:hypothetical protein